MDKRSNIQIGIYKILNTSNGKVYVGSAASGIKKRWRLHKRMLRSNIHHSPYLQRSWNKYGETCFSFEILELCSPDKCLEREQYYLDTLHPQYNVDTVAGSPKGRKYSEEYKNKMRVRNTGNGNPFFGKKHTEETKQLISQHRRGKLKGVMVGEKNPMYKKTHTAEQREKMSEASLAFWKSEEGMREKKKHAERLRGKTNPFVKKGKDHPNYNPTIYVFSHSAGETFTGTVLEFRKTHGLSGEIYYLVNGKYKQYKGWKVTSYA